MAGAKVPVRGGEVVTKDDVTDPGQRWRGSRDALCGVKKVSCTQYILQSAKKCIMHYMYKCSMKKVSYILFTMSKNVKKCIVHSKVCIASVLLLRGLFWDCRPGSSSQDIGEREGPVLQPWPPVRWKSTACCWCMATTEHSTMCSLCREIL